MENESEWAENGLGVESFARGEGQINSLSWIQTVQRQFNMFTSSNKSNYICIKKSIKS